MTHKAAYGPISAEEFADLVNAPYGKAAEVIRKVDPFWGRVDGEKVKYRVRLEGTAPCSFTVVVEAGSEKEAEDLAWEKAETSTDWDFGEPEDYDIDRIDAA